MKKLGDRHNFGLSVCEENGLIIKPRTLLWEFLFLSESSSIRNYLDTQFLKNYDFSPFATAPILKFYLDLNYNGAVEKLSLHKLSTDYKMSELDFKNIGSVIAIAFWFGIGDLHRENLACGIDNTSKLTFFPIDIECILNQFTHINQTLLVPSENISPQDCGLSTILSRLIEAQEKHRLLLLNSFLQSINFLNTLHADIFRILLNEKDILNQPIRVIPKDTKKYKSSIESSDFADFYNSEVEQLKRKDIPYFFRKSQNKTIYYLKQPAIEEVADFSYDSLTIPSPVSLSVEQSNHMIKLKTAILSAAYLAETLELKVKLVKLNEMEIFHKSGVLKIYEDQNKIQCHYI